MFTTSLCGKVFGVTFLFFVSIVLFAFGLNTLDNSKSLEREYEVTEYVHDELLWNKTFRNQLKEIKASLITNYDIYKQKIQKSEIELQIQLFESQEQLENIKGIDERWKFQQKLLELQEQIKNNTSINTSVRNQLTIPMEPSSDKYEEKLVNQMDQHEDLPEYDSYSLISDDFYPKSAFKIESEEEFKLYTQQKQNINVLIQQRQTTKSSYLKSVDQILTIDLPILKLTQTHVTKSPQKNKKQHGSKICERTGGYVTAQVCTHLYYASELCISIKKGLASDLFEWQLSGYNSSSYGCGFNPAQPTGEINQIQNQAQVWTRFPINKNDVFPILIPPLKVHIRHANDPFLAAIHISKNGLLQFGDSQNEKIALGAILCIFSIISFLFVLNYFKSICCPDFHFKNQNQEHEIDKKKKETDQSERQDKYRSQIQDDVGLGEYKAQNQEESSDSARESRPARFKMQQKRLRYRASDIIIEEPDFDGDSDEEDGNTSRDLHLNMGHIKSNGREREVEFSFR